MITIILFGVVSLIYYFYNENDWADFNFFKWRKTMCSYIQYYIEMIFMLQM